MESDKAFLSEDIYKIYLVTINDIRFTPREIDVVACILHGKSIKGIAKFLSTDKKRISERAIDSHVLNIRRKIGGNSRESIVDFIEKSDKYKAIRAYYLSMLVQKEFDRSLEQISAILQSLSPSFLLVFWQEKQAQDILASRLRNYLQLAGVNVSIEIQDNFDKLSFIPSQTKAKNFIIYFIPPENTELNETICYSEKFTTIDDNTNYNIPDSIFLFNKENGLDEATPSSKVKYINIIDGQKPYFLFFEILRKFFPDLTLINDIIESFVTKYKNIDQYPKNIRTENFEQQKVVIPGEYHSSIWIKTSKFLDKFYYLIIALLISIIIGKFISSRYFFQEGYYTEHSYEQIEERINEFADNLDIDDVLKESTHGNHSYILLLQQTVDNLYDKYREVLNDPEMQSKFNYLSCALVSYYRHNNEYNTLVDNYLKSQYPSFKWFKNFSLKEFHDYIAEKVLEKVLNYYNTKYGITDNESPQTIKIKLEPHPYALEDYILLNYHLALGYTNPTIKDLSNDYKFKIAQKYLSVAILGKEYNMLDSYFAERALLILERDKAIMLMTELKKELKKTFTITQNETSLIAIINKITSERQNNKSLQKIMYGFVTAGRSNEDKLKETINGFTRLEKENREYVSHYKPWKKINQEFFNPQDSYQDMMILLKENIYTQAALMNHYALMEYNDPEKLRKAQMECLSDTLAKLNNFLDNHTIQSKWEIESIKVQKNMLAKAIKSLANAYYDERIATYLNKLAETIGNYKFDKEVKDSINLILSQIAN